VAVSPSSTYRVLKAAGRLDRKLVSKSRKGMGFVQPESPHQHWHIDVSYLNLGGTFYFLISVLDGMSLYIVYWEIQPTMTEFDIEIVVQRALEKHPGVQPRIISDNGPLFIAKDFKEFIRVTCLSHVRTSPYYPQSNGKLERFHGTLKRECIRPAEPGTLEKATSLVKDFVHHHNHCRLHSAIGYMTPYDCMLGLTKEILAERDRKLEEARARREVNRRSAKQVA
jgi:putative transposase